MVVDVVSFYVTIDNTLLLLFYYSLCIVISRVVSCEMEHVNHRHVPFLCFPHSLSSGSEVVVYRDVVEILVVWIL